jgi:transposase-like protein
MDFPIVDLMDTGACYRFLVTTLHPDGLRCPRCGRADDHPVHDRHRPPVFDYQCRGCRAVFNAYTGTPLQKTHRTPPQLVLILRGIWQAAPTARLARELGCDRKHLLELRHRLQGLAERAAAQVGPVSGNATEADEMFQNAGEKRHPAPRPRRPAAMPGEQASRARDVRERSAAGGRRGRPGYRGHRAAGGRTHRRGDAP